jgi:uncharacterized protein (TIGR00299 family) protein
MRVLYFDPIIGLSGDMLLAALIDLGVKKEYLKKQLSFVSGAELKVGRTSRQGVSARTVRFDIRKQIKEKQFIPLIKKSKLPQRVKSQAVEIIEQIFAVEKRVHHTTHLHLHELADADTLLDITGVLLAIDSLSVDKIFSKPAKAGSGFIKTVEGNMPAFNFATAELLKGFPVEFLPVAAELTTPTGAAILRHVAKPEQHLVLSKIDKIGMAAGSMSIKGYPNVLRVFLGESHHYLTDECTVIQTNIDDMNPQDYEVLFESLYSAGALDVFLTPTIMKRSRPGILLTVLCQGRMDAIIDILFNHTTSIGFRISNTKRLKFGRRIVKLHSPYGKVDVKIIEYGNKSKYSLEYRDLKRIAGKDGRSVHEIRTELMQLFKKKIVKHIEKSGNPVK